MLRAHGLPRTADFPDQRSDIDRTGLMVGVVDTPCGSGEGDCDSDSDCLSSECLHNVGLAYGYHSNEVDVCE